MKQSKSTGFDFNAITARYDFLNRLLSLNMDLGWRRKMAETIRPGEKTLDLCSGTGDVAKFLIEKDGFVTGADISFGMCLRLKQKMPGLPAVAADALFLPFKAGSFDSVTVAFGIRNFTDIGAGFDEIKRALKKDGRLVILEFTRPEDDLKGLLRKLYLDFVVKKLGGFISGRPEAYQYLASSIKNFMSVSELEIFIRARGFKLLKTTTFFFNSATLFISQKNFNPN